MWNVCLDCPFLSIICTRTGLLFSGEYEQVGFPSASEPYFSSWCGFDVSGEFSATCYLKKGTFRGRGSWCPGGNNGEQLRYRRCGWVPWHTLGMILGEGEKWGGFSSFLAGESSVFCPVGIRDSYVVFPLLWTSPVQWFLTLPWSSAHCRLVCPSLARETESPSCSTDTDFASCQCRKRPV